jgi:hypothetical protein
MNLVPVRRWNRDLPWSATIASLAVLAAGLVLTGAVRSKIPDEVRARQFTLVDKAGAPLAQLTVSSSGEPVVRMMNRSSQADITLRITDAGPMLSIAEAGLSLTDRRGATRARLTALADGSTTLELGSGPILSITESGLSLVDRRGATRARLAALADGSTTLELGSGTGSVAVAVQTDGTANVVLANAGQSRLELAVQPEGPARLTVNDRNGRARAGFTVHPGGLAEIAPSAR